MKMQDKLCCMVLLLLVAHSAGDCQTYNSATTGVIPKSYLPRFVFSSAPGVALFSDLGIRVPSDINTTTLVEEQVNTFAWEWELGLGYHNVKAKVYFMPFAKVSNFPLKSEYEENDSLNVSGQYLLLRRDIEFSYSWFYSGSMSKLLNFEISPILGYTWFKRSFDTRIQERNTNTAVFEYYDQAFSKNVMFGGNIMLIYLIKKHENTFKEKFYYVAQQGPYMSLSFRNSSDIKQFTIEVGWSSNGFANKFKIGDAAYFIRIDVYGGQLRGQIYKIGLSTSLSLKAFWES